MKETLEEELEGAMKTGDTEDEERIQGEIVRLKKTLNIISFKGKGKADSPEIEKARQRIQRVIKDAIDNINKHNPSLSKLLNGSIKTGVYCSFR